jgi:rhamnose utilization protein RhaD (predicted bifunctional aldolase and dehydrogenase)
MSTDPLLDELTSLSRSLGDERRNYAILGEGNTSARVDDETFLVKASGFRLADIGPEGFLRIRFDRCLEMLNRADLADADVKTGLQEARVDATGPLLPSVETVLHAVLLQIPGMRFIGHAHPIPANAILCSARAREAFAGRIFPDEIVCCGVAPCLVDYVDPGLPLARAVQDTIHRYYDEHAEYPRVICLINHGVFALGRSAREVLATLDMFVKVCEILLGTFALGGPHFLTSENVRRIHTRPDEHYRQDRLGLRKEGSDVPV